MQNMMFEGKEKRLDLIAELRATEEWKAASDLEEEKKSSLKTTRKEFLMVQLRLSRLTSLLRPWITFQRN
jgi:hypothetical protein